MARASVCPICGESGLRVYLNQEAALLTCSSIGSSRKMISPGRILRCEKCRFGFREERPSEDELAWLYGRMDVLIYESELRGRRLTAARHLKIIEHFRSPGRLLDVGCASGLFLEQAVRHGWSATGIEPSESLSRLAKAKLGNEANIECTTLQKASLEKSSFDVLTAWDVLEHVPNPVDFVKACAALLRPGGFLFVNVPDLDSLPSRVLGLKWPLLLPEHLNYFCPSSLQLCAARTDLVTIRAGRRMASFSLQYVLFRLAQHRVPGLSIAGRIVHGLGLAQVVVPIALGERWVVWQKPSLVGMAA